MSDKKVCIECKKSLPATDEHFHKSKDGLHSRCKKCRLAHERERRDHKAKKKLQEMERKAIDNFMDIARTGGANIPHSSELVECLMEYFGGARGFANAWMKQFYDSPAGGSFRTKMLEGVVRLVSTNTALGGAKKPLEMWSEEELDAELRRQLADAAVQIQKVEVVDSVRHLQGP